MSYTAIVLAGSRPGRDAFAEQYGTDLKALIPVGGEPMVRRPVEALLASSAVAKILVLSQQPARIAEAIAALDRIRAGRPRSLRFVCLVSCPEGIANLRAHHPDVPVFTAAIDRGLNEHGYIVPGLGDAGDRYFGTRA